MRIDAEMFLGKNIGLFDPATNQDLVVESALAITEQCDNLTPSEGVYLLYTTDTEGRIVQIRKPYPERMFMGTEANFHIGQIANDKGSLRIFEKFASELGIHPLTLMETIMVNAYPPQDKTES